VRVTCPECRGGFAVVRGKIERHTETTRTWSLPHANGFCSGVDIEVVCPGSGARVQIVDGLDRRRPR